MMRSAPRVGCVVLAAGEGRRFGKEGSKLLLPIGGSLLLQRAVDAAARSLALTCTLVLGAYAERIMLAIDPRRCAVVVNRDWEVGLAGSLRAGLAQHEDDDACIFCIADQPFVTADDLDGLIARHAERRASIVALHANGTWGSPALFPRSDFAQLQKLRGDAGAKSYARRHAGRLAFVEASHPDAFADIDTPEDFRRLGRVSHSP